MSIIALGAGTSAFSCLLLYYFYLASKIIGKAQDKIYYYLSCCICASPPIIYTVQMIEMLMTYDGIYHQHLLQYFYIEWIIVTPIFIIKLGQIASFQLREYLLLLLADEALFISGYIFNATSSLPISMAFFGISATLFLGILATLLVRYYRTRDQFGILARRTTHFAIYSTIGTWSIYPVISLLYKFDHISVGQTAIAYIILDVCSKGIFTCIMIGARELAARRQSFTAQFAQHALRIKPLELDTEENIATSSVDDFCRRVDTNP